MQKEVHEDMTGNFSRIRISADGFWRYGREYRPSPRAQFDDFLFAKR